MKKITLFLVVILFVNFSGNTQIVSLASNNWSPIGDVEIITINSDGDNGDGEGDGAQKVNNNSVGTGFGVLYTFDGVMIQGENLVFKTYVFNPNISYTKIKVELYNLTDQVVLTDTGGVTLLSNNVENLILNYTAKSSDQGDILQVRYIRVDDGNKARTFAVDNAKLNDEYLYPESESFVESCFDDTGVEQGWDRIGDVTIKPVTNDSDNGDGVGDGSLSIISLSSGAGVDQGVFYTFDCLMSQGQPLQVETVVFNPRNSYVRANCQLYNATDNTILASSGNVTVFSNTSENIKLSYQTNASDEGDQLQLRLLRADDGNPVRSFSIDWSTINGASLNMEIIPLPLNPACALGVNIDPDIPIEPVTSLEIAEAENVYKTLSNTYLGVDLPDNFQDVMDVALQNYDSLKITRNGYEVNGEVTSYKEAGGIINAFAKYLKHVDSSDLEIAQKASDVIELVAQQFCRGIILVDYNAYDFRNFSRSTMFLRDYLLDSVKDQYAYVLDVQTNHFQNFWGDYAQGQEYNTDWMYNMGDQLVLYGSFRYTNNDKALVRHMKGAKRYVERFLTYTNGTGDGLKPDGTGFHHWTAYDGYMYTFSTVINLIEAFEETSFQIDEFYYYVIRDAVYAQKLMSNDAQMKALSMSGRGPASRKVSTGQQQLKKLAISGGKILGLSTADPLLAGYHNRVWGEVPEFNYSTLSAFEEGFIQLNHGHSGVYRSNDWVAVMKGFSNNMWGSELYSTSNRYGRYQSYGALEILYPGNTALDENAYDVETWDWNYNPGATTIVLPWNKLHGEHARIDELQQKRFVGALAFKNKGKSIGVLKKNYGTYGLFAMDFQEKENQGFSTVYGLNTHNATFTFKKSNFVFKDFIVCLGSGINNNDADNRTVTTLYQRLANEQSGVTVNSTLYTSTGDNTFSGVQDNWVISDKKTGFYVVCGSGDLKIRKGNQQTPNHNENDPDSYLDNAIAMHTLGYIDHGKAPENSGYEYVVKPNAVAADMQTMANDKPYTVLEKSAKRHVVKHNKDKIWGYAFFGPSSNLKYPKGLIKDNDKPCLVMYKKKNKEKLTLSITDPDLGFESRSDSPAITKQISLTLYGNWSVLKSNGEVVKVGVSKKTTTFMFTIEQALALEVDLVKTVKVKKIRISPGYAKAIVKNEEFRFKGVVSPKKATDVSLKWSSSNDSVAVVDQNGVVTGKSVGRVKITLVDQISGKKAHVRVRVIPLKLNDVKDKIKTKIFKFIIYPNPSVSYVNVEAQNIKAYYIYDLNAQLRLFKTNISSNKVTISVNSLKKGIYALRVVDNLGNKQVRLFIKK